jgi:hypothetical protein
MALPQQRSAIFHSIVHDRWQIKLRYRRAVKKKWSGEPIKRRAANQ